MHSLTRVNSGIDWVSFVVLDIGNSTVDALSSRVVGLPCLRAPDQELTMRRLPFAESDRWSLSGGSRSGGWIRNRVHRRYGSSSADALRRHDVHRELLSLVGS